MFKSSPSSSVPSTEDAVIGKNIKLTGSIDSPDAVILHGQVTGDIICKTLEIGTDGKLVGNVTAETVIVGGNLKGDVNTTRLKLESSAFVNGEMTYQIIEVEEGAQLEGSFVQQQGVKKLPTSAKIAGSAEAGA
jgi:cytoskeletal protein CcmA (bactofilin family)